MTPNLRKAIMIRSNLRNKFLIEKSKVSRRVYGKLRNYCVNILREKLKKKKCFVHLNINLITDNHFSWTKLSTTK